MLHLRVRTRKNIAIRKYAKTGKIPKDSKFMDIRIDYKAIIKFLKPFPADISKYHIDEIFPFCKVDWDNIDSIKKVFAPENHQWLSPFDNISKGGKIMVQQTL